MTVVRIPAVLPQLDQCVVQLPPIATLSGQINLCAHPKWERLCLGHLNIPRASMPQLDSEVFKAFQDFMIQKGRAVLCKSVSPCSLLPTQNELSAKKIVDLVGKLDMEAFNPCTTAILVSEGGHIIDGHHRWFTCLILNRPIHLVKIDVKASKLLAILRRFPGVFFANLTAF